jgi:hypothetical protein
MAAIEMTPSSPSSMLPEPQSSTPLISVAVAGKIGYDIAVDSAGNAYVTGTTYSTNFPTTPGALQRTIAGGDESFITKLNAEGNALVYSTFLGGSGVMTRRGIALDSAGNAYVPEAPLGQLSNNRKCVPEKQRRLGNRKMSLSLR